MLVHYIRCKQDLVSFYYLTGWSKKVSVVTRTIFFPNDGISLRMQWSAFRNTDEPIYNRVWHNMIILIVWQRHKRAPRTLTLRARYFLTYIVYIAVLYRHNASMLLCVAGLDYITSLASVYHGSTLIAAWITSYKPSKVWNKISYISKLQRLHGWHFWMDK